MEHEHTPEAIRARLQGGTPLSHLRDWVYGGVDGAVTTFAVVSGVVGADLSARVILILGAASLLADGVSMAVGNYLGTRAEREHVEQVEAIERRHIDTVPEGEREEVRQIFRAKGFEGDLLERVVDTITADRTRWVRTMVADEYGLTPETRSPRLAALSTFAAFLLCGFVPLVPFVVGAGQAFGLSVASTGITFLAIGSLKSRWSPRVWWRSGLETLAVGGAAAAVAYGVGALLARLT